MVLLVLLMHLILLLPWRRWMVWILALLMRPLATRGATYYRTKNHAGKYVGNRPIKLRKSTWKNRIDFESLEKGKVSSHGFYLRHIMCSFFCTPIWVLSLLMCILLIFCRLNHRRKSNCRKGVFFTSETEKICLFIVCQYLSQLGGLSAALTV